MKVTVFSDVHTKLIISKGGNIGKFKLILFELHKRKYEVAVWKMKKKYKKLDLLLFQR